MSVIILVYNGEAYLTEAVESIMQQKHEPLAELPKLSDFTAESI